LFNPTNSDVDGEKYLEEGGFEEDNTVFFGRLAKMTAKDLMQSQKWMMMTAWIKKQCQIKKHMMHMTESIK
jgi:hypothetical protein